MHIGPTLAIAQIVRRTVIVTARHLASSVWSLVAATVVAILAGVVVGLVEPAAGAFSFYCTFVIVLATCWLTFGVIVTREVKAGW